MAFVSLIFVALKLKKLQTALVEEKLEAIKADEDDTHKIKFKFRHIGVDIREAFKKFFKGLCRCSETSCSSKTCYKLGREGSCENFVLRSVFGFLSGLFLTYFLYILFIFQLNVKLTSATIICWVLGGVLTLGLAFSSQVRCIVLLTLPQFFSKRGRQALIAYAFVLVLTGPAHNTLNNVGILSESLACGQEQLKQAVKQIIDVIKKPFIAIKEAIKKVVKTVKEIVKKIKEILLKIKRIVMALVRVIKSAFEFLGKIINICNKELGTPFERCTRVFENAIADCNAKLGPLFNWLCSLTYILKAVCYIVKPFDFVCMLVDFISNSIIGVVIRKVKIFVRHIKTMFYVRIKFSHSFKYQTVSSKSFKEVAKEIVAEVKERSRGIVAFFNFMTSASMMFFLYLVFQVVYYRIKYLTNEKYDNIYITKYFRDIDQKRAKIGKETVLPLTKKEGSTYVPISSAKLSKKERRQLSKAAAALATTSVKLGVHMVADYSLYWILTLITHHARYQSKVEAPNYPVSHITGNGFLAKLLRAIVNAFQPVGIKLEIDTVPCLPIPIPPDFDRYIQICFTVFFCWILTLLEPYGLRFRNYIMGYYHPIRSKQRAIWLYNHILRSRTSFLLMARRNLRRRFGIKDRSDEISCKDWIRSRLTCAIFRICLGSGLQKACLLCGEVFHEKDKNRFVKCRTYGCPGLFCLECFTDLKNICPICLSPLEYGDIDEINEEEDSSGDEPPPKKPKRPFKCPLFPCAKPRDDDKSPLVSEDDKQESEDEEEEEICEAAAEESDSTDYSYTYQYDDYKSQEPIPKTVEWRDVESQEIPDEASMESFIDVDLENKIRVPKGHVANVRMDVIAEVDEEKSDEEGRALLYPEECTCSTSTTTRRVEFIGLPPYSCDDVCVCSDLEEARKCMLRSTMSTSTRSDCLYCTCSDVDIRSTLAVGSETEEELKSLVPKLDLSFLKKKDEECRCDDDNSVLSNRFSYVTYQEISESSSEASSRSLESSSLLTSLQKPAAPLKDTSSVLRKRNIQTQYSTPEIDSPSSMDSYEFKEIQRKKVHQYYDTTKNLCQEPKYTSKPKKRSVGDLFKRLLPKRRRGQNCLPVHQRDIQVQSYNFNRDNWDTFSLDTNSPTYPFASSEASDEEHELLERRRIRGGECTHLINCKLIGRTCPEGKPRSFDAKSELILGRTVLKDFSTLSLPPKPKPTDSKELFSRYFFQNLPENSMQESVKNSSGKTDGSTDITPPSSDSVLSEATRANIFGNSWPKGLTKESHQSLEKSRVSLETTVEVSKDEIKEEDEDVEEEELKEEFKLEAQQAVVASKGPEAKSSQESNKEIQREASDKLEKVESEFTTKKSLEINGHSSAHSTEKSVAKRKSSHLNQLLYKDDKTEISLVQKLSPEKDLTSSRPKSPIRLNISLSNTIVPTEKCEPYSMRSPRDKIVETSESFPVQRHEGKRTERVILSSDKNLQTSDNDIYQTFNESEDKKRRVRPSRQHIVSSSTDYGGYSSEFPEKDNHCQCSLCRAALEGDNFKSRQASLHCNCWKCQASAPSRAFYGEALPPGYHVTAFPPSSTDTEVPHFLPPPPPVPPYRPSSRAAPQPRHPLGYRSCSEQCTYHARPRYSNFTKYPGNYMYSDSSESPFEYPPPDGGLPDLPYQNNEEYLGLVEELQDTLHSRNRNRVKRAMQEFEDRSKQNKSLEKPIIDYDQTSESEEPIIRKIDQLRIDRKICCAREKCSCGKKKQNEPPGPPPQPISALRSDSVQKRRSRDRPSHWAMDPGSGEWFKACGCPCPKHRGSANSKEIPEPDQCTCNCGHRF